MVNPSAEYAFNVQAVGRYARLATGSPEEGAGLAHLGRSSPVQRLFTLLRQLSVRRVAMPTSNAIEEQHLLSGCDDQRVDVWWKTQCGWDRHVWALR